VPTLVKLADGTTAFSQAVDLYAGSTRICALRDGGTLWCWGSGYQNYAGNLALTNVVAVGSAPNLQNLTSDGLYHYNTVAISPKCGSLQ
jgi:alpha-tubulin suppressor-like RCC1 family protein